VLGFHHIELYCSDASSAAGRFSHGLGMDMLAKSDGSTGNDRFVSYCIGSGAVRFVFTAPLASARLRTDDDGADPASARPGLADALGYSAERAREFVEAHGGLAVRAVCISVADVDAAFAACVSGGGEPVLSPAPLPDAARDGADAAGRVAEVRLYGDVVLRLLSTAAGYDGAHMPGYEDAAGAAEPSYGIGRIDHVVGNVWEMVPTIERLKAMTGFHEFAEFTSEEVGTIDSGLNSMVLASDDERTLLPVNEPTYGTRRRSQIHTYLLAHGGEGVQHIALATDDIFDTVRRMRRAAGRGGFHFMDAPSDEYYDELPERIGDALPEESLRKARELGLLVDRDDQGVLLQLFTRPVGDLPTLFLEIIQRVGCLVPAEEAGGEAGGEMVQKGGCGGFGKGNFRELFKSVEDYERSLEVN